MVSARWMVELDGRLGDILSARGAPEAGEGRLHGSRVGFTDP